MAEWFSVTYVKIGSMMIAWLFQKKVWKKENTKWFCGICGKQVNIHIVSKSQASINVTIDNDCKVISNY